MRAAVGESFAAAKAARYKEAIIFGITLAWGEEVQACDLNSKQSQVSFAINNLLLGVGTSCGVARSSGGHRKNGRACMTWRTS